MCRKSLDNLYKKCIQSVKNMDENKCKKMILDALVQFM